MTEPGPDDGSTGSRWARVTSTATGWIDDLTPGQRWTAALVLIMATMVISFGLPSQTVVRQSAASPNRPAAPVPTTAPEPNGDPLPPPTVMRVAPAPGPEVNPDVPATTVPEVSVPPVRPDIVALVRTDPTRLGRDDASIAAAFLGSARFDATVIELTDDDALCQAVVDAGQVAIASHGLPGHLRDCLVDSGVTIIAFDALGGVPRLPGSGQVLSTRRGHRDSLIDLGRWALDTRALGSTAGLVASAEYRNEVEVAVDDLARLGIRFERVLYLPDGPEREPAVIAGVQDFADAGIETVLFAADVDDQSRWVEIQRLLGSPSSYVVSDVGNSIVNESYPAVFGDARAHTSLRTPWWERTEGGPTEAQAACRSHWEGNAPPGAPPSAEEVLVAYLWCQHAWMIVEPALDLVESGTEFGAAARGLVVDSPVTSRVGRFSLFEWGPRRSVALQWDGDCGCWMPEGGFTAR